MKAVKIRTDGLIKLPKEILRLFPPKSELAVSWKGDTISLKRLTALPPAQNAKRDQRKDMSLEEVSEEIHAIRREKRGQHL